MFQYHFFVKVYRWKGTHIRPQIRMVKAANGPDAKEKIREDIPDTFAIVEQLWW